MKTKGARLSRGFARAVHAPIPSREAAPSRFPKLAISTTGIFHAAREHRRTAPRQPPDPLAMPRQLNLIRNGKGGVGKSFFAVNFIQYRKDQQIKHTAIDTANENSTLKRFHPEARFVNLANARELDELVVAVETMPLVVMDCRAASTDLFLAYFAELAVFDVLTSMNAVLTVVSPINHDLDSVEQARIISNAFDRRCRYLVVKNRAFTEPSAIYNASETRKRLLEELAAKEMATPKLLEWLVALLPQENLPVGEGIQHPIFSLMDRQRLKNWQRQFHEQINTVRQIISPGEP
jgi:hypothetical protein